MQQIPGQKKFIWACLILQLCFAILYFSLVRYEPSADASHIENQLGKDKELHKNINKYGMVVDVFLMLFGGFGFLMTFLKRHGFSAIGFTMLLTTFVTEWTVLLTGFFKLGMDHSIHISLLELLEGGLAAAAVLISFGAILGKLNPFQLLTMALIESFFYAFNFYLGHTVMGVVDVGGAIFVHMFGAYFGLSVSFMHRKRVISKSKDRESSFYSSDLFALIGTLILWVYWPSFNAVLAEDDAQHRAIINTYLSLIGSTIATFIASSLMGEDKKFDIIDIQNATLAGGVAVGAIADMMIQPYGALLIGILVGSVSTLGFKKLQIILYEKLSIHDTCGVHNLHGIPGLLSGIFSAVMCLLASEHTYGPSLYKIFPQVSPKEGSDELLEIQKILPEIKSGEGRSLEMQALYQMISIGITIVLALVGGAVSGLVLKADRLFQPLPDEELFSDDPFWSVPPLVEGNLNKRQENPDEFHSIALPDVGGGEKNNQIFPEA